MFSSNLSHIYDELANEVNSLVQSMDTNTGDSVLDNATKAAKGKLSKLSADISAEYSELKRNTIWDRYTIAFYGETNAGKSAIIETLRIMCGEQKKLEERVEFSKILQLHNFDAEHIAETQAEYERCRTELRNVEQKLEQLKIVEFQQMSPYVAEIDRLNTQIESERARMNFWEKLIKLLLMRKSISEIKRIEQEKELLKVERSFCEKKKLVKIEVDNAKTAVNEIEKTNAEITSVLADLDKYADGAIIGTGISDFTKHNSIFTFNLNGVEFDLIDVPGIEGNEKIVKKSILEAVQKAHAVFYVTRKAAAPQTGDGYEGTLEKIKKHLGAQTQVWSIFNQSVTNPIRLNRGLISEDEKKSLQDMDEKLRAVLGAEHYCGNIVLSAYPAFLAVADCLVPNSKCDKSRITFLNKFDKNEILDRSRFNEFLRKLPGDVVGDWRKRIIDSNLNKARVTLKKAIECIDDLTKDFELIKKKTDSNCDSCVELVDLEFGNFEKRLQNSIYKDRDIVIKKIRENAYMKIDKDDLDNDDLENNIFKTILQQRMQQFRHNLKKHIESQLKDLKRELETIRRTYYSNYTEYFDKKYCKFGVDNILDVDISEYAVEPPIDWEDLISTIIGVIVGIITGEWIVGIIVGIVCDIIPKIISSFDKDYKKRRQRDYVDKCLREVNKEIDKGLKACFDEGMTNLRQQIECVKKDFVEKSKLPVLINDKLNLAKCRFENLIFFVGGICNEKSHC